MKNDPALLEHIRDAIERIQKYTRGGRDAFFAREMVQDAVVRNLEVIGQAAKGLSADLRARRPMVPWRRIAGMRDKLIHEYFGVNLELVWETVEGELPTLREEVESLLAELTGG